MSIFNKLFKVFNYKRVKKNNIELLLDSANVNHTIIEFDNFVCKLCAWGEEIKILTEQQRNFYFNQNLEREVNNGGFKQYFYNTSGDFAHETITSLKAINAYKTVDILQTAINQFPNQIAPKNREERQSKLEKMGEIADKIFETLDQRFFVYEDDLNNLNIQYIRNNKEMFFNS